MSDPIALTHNDKTHAWMCGTCYHVHTASDVMFRCDPSELHALRMAHAQKAADQCCRCLCGRALDADDSESLRCQRCRTLDAWGRLCERLARAMALAHRGARPARQPCVRIPPPSWDRVYRRGDTHEWKIPHLISAISERDYSAGWLTGIEYVVWGDGVRGDCDDAREAVDDACACGVWWYYRQPISAAAPSPIMSDPDDYTGPWPVPLRAWCKMRMASELVFRSTWFETAITVASQDATVAP